MEASVSFRSCRRAEDLFASHTARLRSAFLGVAPVSGRLPAGQEQRAVREVAGGVVAGLRVVFERDARGDLRPALTSQRRSAAPVSGSVDGVAFDAPSPGVFAGQSYGNPQVREDAG